MPNYVAPIMQMIFLPYYSDYQDTGFTYYTFDLENPIFKQSFFSVQLLPGQ